MEWIELYAKLEIYGFILGLIFTLLSIIYYTIKFLIYRRKVNETNQEKTKNN